MAKNSISQAIGLLHNIDWQLSTSKFQLDTHINICRYEGSNISTWIEKLAPKINLDDGEPFGYRTFIQILSKVEIPQNDNFWSYGCEIIDKIVSLIGITQGGGFPDLCHIIIIPAEDIQLKPWIESLHEINKPQIDVIQNKMYDVGMTLSINDSTITRLKTVWDNLINEFTDTDGFNRLDNALNFYKNAWRSQTEEEAIIHLNVVLESLFAPHFHSEVCHQVASNVCRFLTQDKAERKMLYTKIKKIYDERSKIIHGGSPSSWPKLLDHLWDAYSITAMALLKILEDLKNTVIFSNDEKRLDFLNELQFS